MDDCSRISRHIENHESLCKLFAEDKEYFEQRRKQLILETLESSSHHNMEKMHKLQSTIEQWFGEM